VRSFALRGISDLPNWLKASVATAIVIALLLLAGFIDQFGLTPADKQEVWGQFGDFLGGILNPLFSIIGLFALLHTIVLQSRELASSTKELKSSAKALKKQNRHNARQQFDNNLFQLLTLNISQANSVTHGYMSGKSQGISTFESAYYDFTRGWDLNKASGNEWIEKFDEWYQDWGASFNSYIYSLSNTIDFIYEANVSKKAKQFAYSTLAANVPGEVINIYFLMVVFSDDHNWFRETLVEIDFFGMCQSGSLRFDLVLDYIGVFDRVD
jgi:hypothetical protein